MPTDLRQYQLTVYRIIGAAMKVHSELNWGLLEEIYNEALAMELKAQQIDCERHKLLPCFYKGVKMEKHYEMDIVVGDIVVELKSVQEIIPAHRAQLFNYLRLTKSPIGIILNFGQPSLQGERYAYNSESNECNLLDKNLEVVPLKHDCWVD